jgi:hypothetical protein
MHGADPAIFAQLKLSPLALQSASQMALIGGILFHIACGQYQTDLAIDTSRGVLSTAQRYLRETVGVVVNNGARVFGWAVPGPWDKMAQLFFFVWKTWPQLLQTHVDTVLQDRRIRDYLLDGESEPEGERVSTRCLQILSKAKMPSFFRPRSSP